MVGDERGNVRLIDQRSAKESLKVRFHCGKVSSLDVHSHSGMLLASGGSMDHAVRFVLAPTTISEVVIGS